MIHPLLRLIVTRPQLLVDHARAYADLAGEELERTKTSVMVRVAGAVVALLMLLVCLVLTGVAVMLWAVTPAQQLQLGWMLVVVPLVPAVLAAVGAALALQKTESPMVELKQQFAADLSMMRQVSGA